MDSVGSENCVENAAEEYSHVQTVENSIPRKKLSWPDMSRTRWLGGGVVVGRGRFSFCLSLFVLSLSLFWGACAGVHVPGWGGVPCPMSLFVGM